MQRSEGYYERTMKGYELAKRHGLQVQFKEQIFNYFLENGLTFKLHPALPSLRSDDYDKWERFGPERMTTS